MDLSRRDPYPYPTYENDATFAGNVSTQKPGYELPTHLAQKRDPWDRLNRTQTLSSARHEVYNHDPQAPRDSLDFVIKSHYNQHEAFLCPKNYTLIQSETRGYDNGRQLKNRIVEVIEPPPPLNHPINIVFVKGKRTTDQIKGAIQGHHSETTNRGYSRKPDGGNFTM